MRGAARARRPKIKIAPPDPARLEWVSPPRWSRDNPRGTTIIFLDVDGVLNRTTKKNVQLEGALLDRLARVALVAESHIVLSSVWRLHGDLRALAAVATSERSCASGRRATCGPKLAPGDCWRPCACARSVTGSSGTAAA